MKLNVLTLFHFDDVLEQWKENFEDVDSEMHD